MNPKCTLPEDRRRDALLQFDRLSLTAEEEKQIRQMFPQYLFFRNEYTDDGWNVSSAPVRICTCTSCGETFEAVRGNYARGKLHHERCNCPNCLTEVEGIAALRYKYDMSSLEQWVKAAVARPGRNGALLIEAGNARRIFNHDNLVGEIDWYPAKRYYFSKAGAVEFYEKVVKWGCGPFEPRELEWTATKTVGEPFQPNICGNCDYDGSYSVIGWHEALAKTDLRYCQADRFFEDMCYADLDQRTRVRGVMKYLGWYCIHPQIEMAVKLGFTEAVNDLVSDGKKNAKLLNWNAKNPAGFLRITPQEAKSFRMADLDFTDLKEWRAWPDLTLQKYIGLIDTAGGRKEMRELMECVGKAGCTAQQGANYLRSLIPECARYAPPKITIIRTWKDYLDMAEKLGYDLTEHSVAMPKNLRERHDNAVETFRQRASEEEQKKYGKRRKMLEKKYGFSFGGFCILVPRCADEIVAEGYTLHHCVGGYAARHVEGKTTILFMRRQKRPERPFLTIEVYEEKGKIQIRQIHGYKNERYSLNAVGPGERYEWFLEPWLDWVNSGSERDRKGNPILPKGVQTA